VHSEDLLPDALLPRIGSFERILLLRRLETLYGLPTRELGVLAEAARERFFAKGERLLRQGEPVPSVSVVVEGLVDVRRRGRTLPPCGPGAGFGGLSLLARDAEGLEATAESDTLTLELEADDLLEILEDHFSILHHLLQRISGQVIDLLAPGHLSDLLPPDAPPPAATNLDLVERILFLKQFGVFRRASVNALAELSRGLTEIAFPAGTVLWRVGEPPGGLLLVLGGRVRGSRTDCTSCFTLGPGSPLGALEAVAERPRWFDAVAETNVTALHGSAEGLFDVFEDNPGMGLDYLAVMAQSLALALDKRMDRAEAVAHHPDAECAQGQEAPPPAFPFRG
jgi:CRP-like cAMP-binding protein